MTGIEKNIASISGFTKTRKPRAIHLGITLAAALAFSGCDIQEPAEKDEAQQEEQTQVDNTNYNTVYYGSGRSYYYGGYYTRTPFFHGIWNNGIYPGFVSGPSFIHGPSYTHGPNYSPSFSGGRPSFSSGRGVGGSGKSVSPGGSVRGGFGSVGHGSSGSGA
jgi:hypothetical protein